MSMIGRLAAGMACIVAMLAAQTADELASKNLAAHGGVEKMKSLRSLRMIGHMQQGSVKIDLQLDSMPPDLVRQSFSFMAMTGIEAYDGNIGWRVMPFSGRKDPEMLGEDDLRSIQDEADFYGHLVDYKEKGSTLEYLGHDTVDGDDAYRLKLTLKNGDIIYYYLDPETFLEIRTEMVQHIHGSVRETFSEMGSYKLVNGIFFPFAMEQGNPRSPGETSKLTIDKIEADVAIDPAEFKMPAAPAQGKKP